MCGEKDTPIAILIMRARITPACAGKSLALSTTAAGVRDHPRMCGEKTSCSGGFWMGWGSPPHVRGKGCESVTAFS